ncbi:glycerophosphodiester phosphodiesterase family protein [Denitrobaculum tricleocarpae]|uniref:glycerophosphodiester phosphodiesterase n=1 Tax=Denitrobaculum tricleocarpae TaxID=2591009 RepID=A0A545U2C8_9PROT|nr:glycerophosphodiester phosphodiesterase family protein [Denitrobaculum tricleocarpae]TQV83632.1 glycerophosphodiester phosphodiesterase [Denitrobaculum tricleocarpae]
MRTPLLLALFAGLLSTSAGISSSISSSASAEGHASGSVQIGPRPFFLVDQMAPGELKTKLQSCSAGPFAKSDWSIGHRGAPLQFPEHTEESYRAAARMGAGIMECDVTFTKDRELVCRHAQNDLHTTTNILATPLAQKCTAPFTPASGSKKADAECRASDITLAEFRSLTGKMDAADRTAETPEAYMDGTAGFRTDLYAGKGSLMTHAESIELFKELGVKFTPELKSPSVSMPYEGDYTQAMYAQQMINEYKEAGVPPSDVFAQSFNLEDVLYWIENEPEFGKQAVYLDNSYRDSGWSPESETSWRHSMTELKEMGVNYIAPPLWVLVKLDGDRMVPSLYAERAKEAGLKIISWTAERSGFLTGGGGWYFQTVKDQIDNEGDVFELMHVLHKDVGIVGLFSDWPATTTYYANCFGLE